MKSRPHKDALGSIKGEPLTRSHVFSAPLGSLRLGGEYLSRKHSPRVTENRRLHRERSNTNNWTLTDGS